MVTTAMKSEDNFFRKAVTDLDIVWKSRNITLLERVHIVKAIVFPPAPMQPPLLGRGVALLGHRP